MPVARSPYIEPREVLRRYLCGRLDPAQARAFEQSLRSEPGELRRQLRLARELGRTDTAAGTGDEPRLRRLTPPLLTVLLSLALVALAWVLASPSPATVAPMAPADNAPAGERVAVVSVPDHTADWADSHSIPAVRLDTRAERLDLLPQLRTTQPVDWRLELTPVGSSQGWRGDTLGSLQPTLSVPAAQLPSGDYELRVAHTPAQGGERHLRIFRFELWRPATAAASR